MQHGTLHRAGHAAGDRHVRSNSQHGSIVPEGHLTRGS
jgi:hypothetical protein